MLGGYLEFFMKPAVAEMYQCTRTELDELIQTKVSKAAVMKFSLHLYSIFLFRSFSFIIGTSCYFVFPVAPGSDLEYVFSACYLWLIFISVNVD